VLKNNLKEYREGCEKERIEVLEMLRLDPECEKIIPGINDPDKAEMIKESYIRAFACVVTRCFGWGLPRTVVVPFADFINHHNVDSSYDVVHKDWPPVHPSEFEDPLKAESIKGHKSYHTISKAECNYSLLYQKQGEQMLEEAKSDGFESQELTNRTKNYMNLEEIRHNTIDQGVALEKLRATQW
jgi:hypothetical protein